MDISKNRKESKPWIREEVNNITAFFNLLLKVDRRVNPYLYKEIDKSTRDKSSFSKNF